MRGTDDLILRREDGAPPTGTTGGGSGTDGTYERQRIYLTDTIGSPVAILDNANAAVVERISYDAYGNARHHSPADLDGNGAVDGWDQALLLGAWGDDVADIADIDRNGDVDGWDQALLLGAWGAAMPAGWITFPGEDNIIGFAGYVHNKEAPGSAGGAYLARHRWYDSLLGRWLSRDPAGYVDGMNVYLYVAANPLVLVDPLGLFADLPPGGARWYHYVQACAEGYYSSLWENTGGALIDGATAAADMAGDRLEFGFAVVTDDPSRALDTDLGQALAGEMAGGAGPIEAALNVGVVNPATAVAENVGQSFSDAASGDPEAIGAVLRTPGEIILGDKGVKVVAKGASAMKAGAKVEDGIVYSRHNPMTGETYIGASKSPQRYLARQSEHDRALAVQHEYRIIDRAKPRTALRVAEESAIRLGGGPATRGGSLANKRFEMTDVAYRAAGGRIRLPEAW